jgi:hypothetical protein
MKHLPRTQPPDDDDNFMQWRKYWQRAGVFTVADQFGDDGTRGGEFEAFLSRVDHNLLMEARAKLGERNKPREVLDLYKLIAKRFPQATKLDPAATLRR